MPSRQCLPFIGHTGLSMYSVSDDNFHQHYSKCHWEQIILHIHFTSAVNYTWIESAMFCEIFSISTLIIIIYLAILVYFIQSLFAKQTKTQRQNLQIKWNAMEEDLVILHQFSRARFCPSPSPYPIKLETFLRMHNIKVHKSGVCMFVFSNYCHS